jgi:hypothetical protein
LDVLQEIPQAGRELGCLHLKRKGLLVVVGVGVVNWLLLLLSLLFVAVVVVVAVYCFLTFYCCVVVNN